MAGWVNDRRASLDPAFSDVELSIVSMSIVDLDNQFIGSTSQYYINSLVNE